MVKAQFDQLYEEGAENGMVLGLPLHPYLIGQPHRIDALHEILAHMTARDGVWFATANEIAGWYYDHYYDTVAAEGRARAAAGVR
jgi:hypothetical protein